jgi:malonyl-CoA O-methyltransferase
MNVSVLKSSISKYFKKQESNNLSSVDKALQWARTIYKLDGGKFTRRPNVVLPTEETTGYMIATLCKFGEKDLAIELAKWEASRQQPSGAFSYDGVPYTFDTSQVVRGFLAVVDDVPELEDNLRRACEYVCSKIAPDGEVLHDSYDTWIFPDGTMLSEYGNLYVLPPLLQAGEKLGEPKYIEAARRGMDYLRRKPDLVEFKRDMTTLSHYFGYMMEALVDLGEFELAKKGLEQARAIQRKDGAIPAWPGANWVCSTGMAQLAIAWYKLGQQDCADKAMAHLERIQNPSGGFYGSYGRGALYFPKQEIGWAVKFFLDAYYFKIKTDFNVEVPIYSPSISDRDGRVQEIVSFLGDINEKSVVEVGCGKGRFLRILKERFPKASLYGLDISDQMLRFCPEGVTTVCGSMLDIKFPDNRFDAVYCIEALEHAVRIEAATKELVRILKPGGKIVIIDKNIAKLGKLELKPWEQWFDPKQIVNILRSCGVEAQFKYITYDKETEPDELFVAWEGVKMP